MVLQLRLQKQKTVKRKGIFYALCWVRDAGFQEIFWRQEILLKLLDFWKFCAVLKENGNGCKIDQYF